MKTERFIVEYHEDINRFYVDFKPYVRDKIAFDREGIISWLDVWIQSLSEKVNEK
jgi:hypothetical protein